jgi:hypothetical protein
MECIYICIAGYYYVQSYALDGFICICIQAYFEAYAYIHSYIVYFKMLDECVVYLISRVKSE